MRNRPTVRERLYTRLVLDEATGCLLWTGSISGKGYGYMGVNGKNQRVHRVAWELENGPIPEGMTIDHVKARGCRYKHCANVAHLEVVTVRENNLRSNNWSGLNAAKTHCPQGHPYDEENTRFRPDGGRVCRICHRDSKQASRARLRSTRPAPSERKQVPCRGVVSRHWFTIFGAVGLRSPVCSRCGTPNPKPLRDHEWAELITYRATCGVPFTDDVENAVNARLAAQEGTR